MHIAAGNAVQHFGRPSPSRLTSTRHTGAREVESVLPVGARVTIYGELAQARVRDPVAVERFAKHGHPFFLRPDK